MDDKDGSSSPDLSMSGRLLGSPDLSCKYQKLAMEYSKMRAQVTVLKKAVLEEQDRVGSLEDLLRERDQSLRKGDMEQEGLKFRNQQLCKRVEFLQGELDRASHGGARGKGGSGGGLECVAPGTPGDFERAIGEELQKRIEENETLHSLVDSLRDSQSQKEDDLKKKVMSLEWEIQKMSIERDELGARHQADLARIREEKGSVEFRLHRKSQELGVMREELEKLQVQLARREQEERERRTAAVPPLHPDPSMHAKTKLLLSNHVDAPSLRSPGSALPSVLSHGNGMCKDLITFFRKLSDVADLTEEEQSSSLSPLCSSLSSFSTTLSSHPFSTLPPTPARHAWGLGALQQAINVSESTSAFLGLVLRKLDPDKSLSEQDPLGGFCSSLRRFASHVSQCGSLCHRWDALDGSLQAWLKELALLLMNLSISIRDISKRLNSFSRPVTATPGKSQPRPPPSQKLKAVLSASEELLSSFLGVVACSQKLAVELDDNLLQICDSLYNPSSSVDGEPPSQCDVDRNSPSPSWAVAHGNPLASSSTRPTSSHSWSPADVASCRPRSEDSPQAFLLPPACDMIQDEDHFGRVLKEKVGNVYLEPNGREM